MRPEPYKDDSIKVPKWLFLVLIFVFFANIMSLLVLNQEAIMDIYDTSSTHVGSMMNQASNQEPEEIDFESLKMEITNNKPTFNNWKVSKEYNEHVAKLVPIPKLIHFTFPSKEVANSKNEMILNGLQNLVDLNPGWELKVWEDKEVEEFLIEKLPADEWERLKDRHIVEKSDVFRLLLMYYVGGFYQDIDRVANIPFNKLFTKDTKVMLATHYDVNFAQDIMCSSPGNHVFWYAYELNAKRRKQGHKGVIFLGPNTYFDAATKVIFGRQGSGTPEIMNKIRESLTENPYTLTHREVWSTDTMVFTFGDVEEKDYKWRGRRPDGGSKDKIYREFGIRHWTKDVLQ